MSEILTRGDFELNMDDALDAIGEEKSVALAALLAHDAALRARVAELEAAAGADLAQCNEDRCQHHHDRLRAALSREAPGGGEGR